MLYEVITLRESFAVEQVEVSKGPSSSFAGRGTAGGAVNSITKQATTDYDFTKLSVGLVITSYSIHYTKLYDYSTYADCDMLSFGISSISKVGPTYYQNVKTLDERNNFV